MTPAASLAAHAVQIHELATRRRAANPRVFGSVLHGRDTVDSDIDILVDTLPGATLFDLGWLQMDLEELLGRRVDLLTPGDISQAFRATVIGEARPI